MGMNSATEGRLPRCQQRLSPKRERGYAPLAMPVVKNKISNCKQMVRSAVGAPYLCNLLRPTFSSSGEVLTVFHLINQNLAFTDQAYRRPGFRLGNVYRPGVCLLLSKGWKFRIGYNVQTVKTSDHDDTSASGLWRGIKNASLLIIPLWLLFTWLLVFLVR